MDNAVSLWRYWYSMRACLWTDSTVLMQCSTERIIFHENSLVHPVKQFYRCIVAKVACLYPHGNLWKGPVIKTRLDKTENEDSDIIEYFWNDWSNPAIKQLWILIQVAAIWYEKAETKWLHDIEMYFPKENLFTLIVDSIVIGDCSERSR